MAPTKSNSPLWILLIVVMVALLFGVVWMLGGKDYNWREDYRPSSKEPYGTYIFHQLLQDVRSNQSFVMMKDSMFRELPVDPTPQVDNYIFIGQKLYANLDDARRILEFVAAGNNAYIFCDQPLNLVSDSLIVTNAAVAGLVEDFLPEDEEDSEEWAEEEEEWEDGDITNEELPQAMYSISDTVITLYLDKGITGLECDISKINDFEIVPKDWTFFADSIQTLEGKRIERLGHFDEEYSNFIGCAYGNGKVYFHSTPIVFTNYYMRDIETMHYCRSAMKTMGPGLVYWDEDNRTWSLIMHEAEEGASYQPQEGPLEFILSEPALRWAWYLLLATGLLYLMFGARRKQRIIPPVENMENTSIEYTEVISQMFMKQRDHKKLVTMKMDLFRAFLRDRFTIRLPASSAEEDEKLYKQISTKSSVSEDLVMSIFSQNKYLSALVTVETDEMLSFHNKLEEFYAKCK